MSTPEEDSASTFRIVRRSNRVKAKPKSQEKTCHLCLRPGLFWKDTMSGVICNDCNTVAQREKAEYDRDAELKRLVLRECQACGATRDLVIHHIHGKRPATAQGVLCRQCNLMLGRYGDDPERMMIAAKKMVIMDGMCFGKNHWDPWIDGEYVPPYKYKCPVCVCVVLRKHINRHEGSAKHQENAKVFARIGVP